MYQVRVRGDFPSQAENAIIALSLVEEAPRRWEDMPGDGRLVLGVDVARFGDDETVIFPVRGKKALSPIVLRGLDAVQVAGKVLEVARELAIPGELPLVKVDSIGVGSGVADFLRYRSQVECVGVNVANAATVKEYALLRDQLWFGVQKWPKEGGAIPPDPKLEAELVAPTYAFDLRGRIKVEPKAKIKERLRRSPDRADALALAVGPLLPGGELRISWLW